MKKIKTKIRDLFIIEKNKIHEDERGLFFESWNEIKFEILNLNHHFKQDNISISKKNVIRGLHFQSPPKAQGKLVQVLKGSILDVIVDLRKKDSPKKWGLLLKPLPQIALVDAILFLKRESDLDDNQIYKLINKINWSYAKGSLFENMVITPEGNILTGGKITERLKNMILFWVLGKKKFLDVVGQEVFDSLNSDFNSVNTTSGKEFPEENKR